MIRLEGLVGIGGWQTADGRRKEQMDWYADLKKNGTGIWWGVYDKTNMEFCGAGGYND